MEDYGLTLLQVFKYLENEVQLLTVERENLLDIEEKLWLMVYEDIEYKSRKNQELRAEIEKQKKNCVELERGLKFINENHPMTFG